MCYITDDYEDLKLEIRCIGKYLAESGGYQLMFAVFNLLGLKNNKFRRIIESVWDGIKDINGKVCWMV